MIRITKTTKAPKGLMVTTSDGSTTPAMCLQVFENGTVVPVGSGGDVWGTVSSFYWRKTRHIDYREPEARHYLTQYAMPERLALQLAYDRVDKLKASELSMAYSDFRDAMADANEHVRVCLEARDAALRAL